MWVEIQDRIINLNSFHYFYIDNESSGDTQLVGKRVGIKRLDIYEDDDGFDVIATGDEREIKDLYNKLRGILIIKL